MKPSYVGILIRGGVGVLATDTLYGIVGSALNEKTVERIYKLRKRNLKKPMIVLIGDMGEDTWSKFGIRLLSRDKNTLRKLWPNKISVIVPCPNKKFDYLHRGTKTIAFRMPKSRRLQVLLQKTGPLVAPSANWEGYPPAKTIREAEKYFGDRVDFYQNAGRRASKPSTLVKLKAGKIAILRPGAVRIDIKLQKS